LMMVPILVLSLAELLEFSTQRQVLVTTGLPLILLPLASFAWARIFDRRHIISYRALHAWSFVLTNLLFWLGLALQVDALVFVGAAVLGAAYAGGQLGWNLGHNDFAKPEQSALYMGVHVSLNGIRGLIAPLLGVVVYRMLAERGMAQHALLLPLLLNVVGALGFVRQNRRRNAAA
jgi:hypothetical protein